VPLQRSAVVRAAARVPKVRYGALAANRRWLGLRERWFRDRINRPHAVVPELSAVEQHVVDRLRSEGIATVLYSDLVGDADMWREFVEDAVSWQQSAAVAEVVATYRAADKRMHGDHVVYRYGKAPRSAEAPIHRIATSGAVLAVCDAYFGVRAVVLDAEVWHIAADPEAEPLGARQWHRDGQDIEVVKVFVYVHDITEEHGPFQYALGSRPGERWSHIAPRDRPLGATSGAPLPDGCDVVTATHPAGTLVFADTSALHRGGHGRLDRLSAVAAYVTPASPWVRLVPQPR
jgi:hypothetical protein